MTAPLTGVPEPIDPQPAGDERATLTGFLDYYRQVLLRKLDGVSDADARRTTVEPSDLNLLGLLRHLADVERNWFRRVFTGDGSPPLFYGASHPEGDTDGDHHPGATDTVASALELWRREVEHSRIVVAAAELDTPAVVAGRRDGRPYGPVNLRWILVHMIEEYARHCGHADLLRERIDGMTGD
jgi:uncharacterized damage-inducible protein DinB